MDFLILPAIAFLLWLLVAPVLALLKAGDARHRVELLENQHTQMQAAFLRLMDRLERAERELARHVLPRENPVIPSATEAPVQRSASTAEAPAAKMPVADNKPRIDLPPPSEPAPPQPAARPVSRTPDEPPPLPPAAQIAEEHAPVAAPAPRVKTTLKPVKPAFTLEQFLGVKMFAWVGGLALFLGIVFFVKYAFEQNLISPAVRTLVGFLIGGGLVGAGVRMRGNQTYQVLAQTLAATGVLILYGVTYAAHQLYHFPAFGTLSTFAYMSVITLGAFVLAVRMNAQVIAVLGMAGGFLTPYLVNTGEDNPFGLFSYVLLLDLGLMTVARYRRWSYLVLCAAAGTVLMQLGWYTAFFKAGNYAEGARVWIPIGIHLFFPALFALGTVWLRRSKDDSLFPAAAGLATAAWSMLVAFTLLTEPLVASRPLILHGFLFALNALVLWQIWLQPRLAAAQWVLALATFAHLIWWSDQHLDEGMLITALVSYTLFGVIHSAFAMAALRWRPEMTQAQEQGVWMGPVASILMMVPVMSLPSVPWQVWPAILLMNCVTMAVSAKLHRLPPILGALGTTWLALSLWLFRLPVGGEGLFGFLSVLGLFTLMFAGAGSLLANRLRPTIPGALPVVSSALAFLLLITAAAKLQLPNPSPLFAVGLALGIFFLIMARKLKVPALGLNALLCLSALEYAWYATRPAETSAPLQLAWFVGIAAVVAVHPFVRRRDLEKVELPWISSAAAWLAAFPLVYQVMTTSYPNHFMGLVPAAFALPLLASLAQVLRDFQDSPTRQTQVAWFGGSALLFITLIFPVQFDHEWLTVGWAFEGAALCWLFTRVPHEGLRKVGIGLLTASFARLALNPAVLTYHPHSDTPIWNWYLYTYGLVALAQFATAALWLAPPRDRLKDVNVRAMTCGFGVILLFLLLNLEIADYFTPPGHRFLLIKFGGNFARSMTYSIAWALFALALLIAGFRFRTAAARYAGIGLMGLTLLKLFLNDLANIGSIYRIGALIVVAIIALGASFLYQRFYSRERGEN